jgi:hypothetical protein
MDTSKYKPYVANEEIPAGESRYYFNGRKLIRVESKGGRLTRTLARAFKGHEVELDRIRKALETPVETPVVTDTTSGSGATGNVTVDAGNETPTVTE